MNTVQQCDDGNNYNGDGCNSQCIVEPGYQCDQTCTEICGDGFNFGHVQCDDGNLLNGDGCSSNCE